MEKSVDIERYINNSKIRGKFLRWKKPVINIYITPIYSPAIDKEFLYSKLRTAISNWNDILKENYINIRFEETTTPSNSDITILWTKVGRIFEGMCKYPAVINDEIKRITIEIGLPNEHSGKNTTEESIFFVMMHELGHSLGLGHGIEPNDLMFVPHQKNISKPSANDIYVLKLIYSQL